MDFKELKKTNCSKHIEKKGKFSYLSWPYMVDQLRIHLPGATIQPRMFDNKPYIITEAGAMVETFIENNHEEIWSEWLPVMDNKNQALKNPDVMAINKAIQRCKAKCISEYTGIGLYIYMGEDLPEAEVKPKKKISISANQVAWLSDFCKRHEIITKNQKDGFKEHYGFDPYKTTAEDFENIKIKIESDHNENEAA